MLLIVSAINRRSLIALDAFVYCGIGALLVLCPLAFGAAHPWPTAITEFTIFGLLVVFLIKLVLSDVKFSSIPHPSYRLWLLLILFAGWILFELVPLPPSVERILSPATYELYKRSVWSLPVETGYSGLGQAWTASGNLSPKSSQKSAELEQEGGRAAVTWRPLSIQETLTKSWLLKVLAYLSLFVLVLQYPFGSGANSVQAEFHFYRLILRLMLIVGLGIAIIGIVQQATWNGRMLWFYVPYDWGGPQLFRADRARGPFVNADHFANFLSLIFPLTLGSALFPTFIAPRRSISGWRIFSACTAFVIFCAALLSLSRGGLLSIAAGTAVLIWLSSGGSRITQARYWHSKTTGTVIAICLLLTLTIAALSFVGSDSRHTLDSRVGETIAEVKFAERLMLWRDTIKIIRDFPVFGVGLGCWPEIFPKYRSAPWSFDFFRESHNDYLELASETGLVGFVLLASLGIAIAVRLRSSIDRLRSDVAPVYYSLIGAVIGLSLHELVDFSLHIPANAIYLTLIVAMALRIAGRATDRPTTKVLPALPWLRVPVISAAVGVAVFLMVSALTQKKFAYPHEVVALATSSDIADFISTHPANALGHLLLTQVNDELLTPERELGQLSTAVWLDPVNPRFRDAYSALLLREGQDAAAQKQIEYSVSYSPNPGMHAFLREGALTTLSTGQQEAVRKGFRSAIAAGLPGAVDGLAWFYWARGDRRQAAEVFAAAAETATDKTQQVDWLLSAGLEFAEAGLTVDAKREFTIALAASPMDPRGYQGLIAQVLGPAKDFEAATSITDAGITAGASAFALNQSLALMFFNAGLYERAEAAEGLALKQHQYDAGAISQMGQIYIAEQRYSEAAVQFRRVTELQPFSAQARFNLASAEEADFDFAAADDDFKRAVALAPDNSYFRSRYSAFCRKLVQSQPKHSAPDEGSMASSPDENVSQ